jgi:DNA-binding NtrC family response regulator
VSHIEDDAVEALMAYDWPGNVRELENVIERAVVLADGPALSREDLPVELRQRPTAQARRRLRVGAGANVARARTASAWPSPAPAPERDAPEEGWDAEVEAFERQRLLDALSEAQGNKSEAARLLAMPRSTFFSRLKKHGLT